MIRVASIAALVVFGFALDAPAQQAAPAVDPCKLVTAADVEAIVGRLKGLPKSDVSEGARVCSFAFTDRANELEIWVYPAAGLERARAAYKDLTVVTDVGAEAFLRRNPTIDWIELYAKKGGVTLQVAMPRGAGDADKVKALARKALAAL